MEIGEMPVKTLSQLAGSKAAYKLSVSQGVVRMAVDGFPARWFK